MKADPFLHLGGGGIAGPFIRVFKNWWFLGDLEIT